MPLFERIALELALLQTPQSIRELSQLLGFTKGRLLSEIPRDWVKRVYDGMEGIPEPRRTAAKNMLRRLKEAAGIRPSFDFDSTQAWTANAVAARAAGSTDRVVAHVPPDASVDDVDSFLGSAFDTDAHGANIQLTLDGIESVIKHLVEAHRRIVIVDSYFDPTISRALDLLERIVNIGRGLGPLYIDIFCKFEQVAPSVGRSTDPRDRWARYSKNLGNSLSTRLSQSKSAIIRVVGLPD